MVSRAGFVETAKHAKVFHILMSEQDFRSSTGRSEWELKPALVGTSKRLREWLSGTRKRG